MPNPDVAKALLLADRLDGIRKSDAIRAAAQIPAPPVDPKTAPKVMVSIDPAGPDGDFSAFIIASPPWSPGADTQWKSRFDRKMPDPTLFKHMYINKQRAREESMNFWEATEQGYQNRLNLEYGASLKPMDMLMSGREEVGKAWIWGPNYEFTGFGRIAYLDNAEELRGVRNIFRDRYTYNHIGVEKLVEEGFEVAFHELDMHLQVHPCPSLRNPDEAEYYIRFRSYEGMQRWRTRYMNARSQCFSERDRGRPY